MKLTLEALSRIPMPRRPRLPDPPAPPGIPRREPTLLRPRKTRAGCVPASLVALPDLPGDDPEMMAAIRSEAAWFVRHGRLPAWMDCDDLVSAGWLGYRRGLVTADPARGDPRTYARISARHAMRHEIMGFIGKRRPGRPERLDLTWLSEAKERQVAGRPEPTPAEQAARGARETVVDSRLRDILRALPRKLRQAVYLRYIRNLQLSEIAAAMSVHPRTASKHVKLGIRELRRSLGDRVPDIYGGIGPCMPVSP